jgi:hypothetical protein
LGRFWHKADMPPLSAICPLSGGLCCKTILPVRARGCVVAKSPPQHRQTPQGNKKKTRKKRDV